jgi:hypothetical protein
MKRDPIAITNRFPIRSDKYPANADVKGKRIKREDNKNPFCKVVPSSFARSEGKI